MQTWAKRGIQTALVTGGLLMLGTGIASADENVNPDTPAGPLDLNASIPVDISGNALGTLGKQVDLPEFHKELSTAPATDRVNHALARVATTGALKPTAPGLSKVNGVTSKVTGAASQAGESLSGVTAKRTDQTAAPSVEPNGDVFEGNKVAGNVVLPIQITGNAIGVLGNAETHTHSAQTYTRDTDIDTTGAHGGLAGNAVNLDWALPVQISGNALGLVGSGRTSGSATQSTATTGDVETDGTNGAAAGNVVSPQGATPVQVSGNALGGLLGHADTDFDSVSEADSGGYVITEGSHGAGTGNVAALPIALPLKASNNAISGGGDADATGGAVSSAIAGDTTPGLHDDPSYIQTHGDDAFLAGNVVQPQGALPATVVGNAAALVGNSVAGSGVGRAANIIGTEAQAGGFTSTAGRDGAASGNIVDAPVALPAEVFCVGGALVGSADAAGCENDIDATAGGGTYTNGNGSFLGGNSVHPQPAGTAEVFGLGGAVIGNAVGTASETKTVNAGGYNGSQGNDSTGSGNVVQVPVALPAEVFGAGGALVGQGVGAAEECKDITSGGGGNTQDDHGTGSANLVAAPVSLPAQVFGVGGALVGQGHGAATTDTTSTAGGDTNANGKEGTVAGNLAQVPVSLPAQVHGIGAALVGNGFGESDDLTDSTAGGDATATGEGGTLAGNIAQVPAGAAASVFGIAADWGGVADGTGVNDVVSTAGGDSATNGDGGSIAGNVVSAQALPVAQVFGDAASLAGVARGAGLNNSEITSGGDITSSGVDGALSGDIFDVPVPAVAQVFGVAASLSGVAHAVADNTTLGTVSGETHTAGEEHALSGLDRQVPVGGVVQVFDIPAGVVAVVDSRTRNVTEIDVAERAAQLIMPVSTSELQAAHLPTLPSLKSLPLKRAEAARADRADLTDIVTRMPGMPQAGKLPSVGSVPGAQAITEVLPKLPVLPGADGVVGGHALPGRLGDVMPHIEAPSLPNVDASPTTLLNKSGVLGLGNGKHMKL